MVTDGSAACFRVAKNSPGQGLVWILDPSQFEVNRLARGGLGFELGLAGRGA